MPSERGMGSEGSKTHDNLRHVPLVEPLSRICQRLPLYSKMQWTRETEASWESLTWMVLPSPRPKVHTLSQSTSFSPMRGPEMKSNSSGAMGTDEALAAKPVGAPEAVLEPCGWGDIQDEEEEASATAPAGPPASPSRPLPVAPRRSAPCWQWRAEAAVHPRGRCELSNSRRSSWSCCGWSSSEESPSASVSRPPKPRPPPAPADLSAPRRDAYLWPAPEEAEATAPSVAAVAPGSHGRHRLPRAALPVRPCCSLKSCKE
mmetsp:Transcript_25488/g.53879  ORF Transcript_25488/g.53879 Transcript_25488/m.53879 type:complete len:260 (-) Transcript_25488:131-910(-)